MEPLDDSNFYERPALQKFIKAPLSPPSGTSSPRRPAQTHPFYARNKEKALSSVNRIIKSIAPREVAGSPPLPPPVMTPESIVTPKAQQQEGGGGGGGAGSCSSSSWFERKPSTVSSFKFYPYSEAGRLRGRESVLSSQYGSVKQFVTRPPTRCSSRSLSAQIMKQ